jgi:hypothetical protein
MATRQNTFLLKRSNVIGKIPPLSGLTVGELGLNTADAILYTLFTSGTTGGTEVREIGWNRIHRTGDTVNGDFTFYGNIQISGSSQPNGFALSITGDTSLSGSSYQIGNFIITGDTTQLGNFDIAGNTFQLGNFDITGDVFQLGNSTQTGNVTLSGNTFITGNTDQVGNVNITGNTIIDGSLSADTITITDIPTLNNTLFQILGRNENTGDVEYRQVNTIGNNVTILTGGTYSAQTTIDNVIGVDTSLTTTTIYLPDSVSSGRLRFEIKDIGLNAYNNPITIIAAGSDTIISYTNSQTLILESEGGAIILFNTGLGQWWQM